MARLANEVGDDDMLEKSSTYSMFGQSMSNFNPNATGTARVGLTEDNMDDYLEALLQKARDKNKAANEEFFDHNAALQNMRDLEEEHINDILKEEQWKKDLDELKVMNQVNLKEFVIHEQKEEVKEEKLKEESPAKAAPIKFELAEERIMREILEARQPKA